MKNTNISFEIENIFMTNKTDIVLGLDEAGRGCLAGPVVAACVWINQELFPKELLVQINDSKKLSEIKRNKIFSELQKLDKSVFMFEYQEISSEIIDEINILQASLLAMGKAYQKLLPRLFNKPVISLVDGNQSPDIHPCQTIIAGDAKSYSIATASIIAKVKKDELLNKIAEKYPMYNFEKNKGYGTKSHLEALGKYGISPFHRKSYAPVKKYIK